jgi:hypothetical protein
VSSPAGRFVLSGLTRTRVGSWEGRAHPVDVVGRIAPTATILVHDPEDWYFDGSHARRLYAAAREPKELWWRPGGGHGSDLLTSELAEELLDRLAALAPTA